MDADAVAFRKYEPSDLPRCAELAEQAWPVRDPSVHASDRPRAFEPWIESTSYSSTYSEVATSSGEVIGFLFGVIDQQKSKGSGISNIADQFWMVGRFLARGEGQFTLPFSAMLGFMFTEFRLAVNRPDADSEIDLLIVDSRFRGKGIGKAMVDRFVRTAKDLGSHAVAVYTDDKTSNWRFYELYGFRKLSTFYDHISSFFAGQPANAIYYILDLKPGLQG